MWDALWKFAMDHFIFHTIVIMSVLFIIFGGSKRRLGKFRFGKDGIEFDGSHDQIDPKAPCPYTESKKRSMEVAEQNTASIAQNAAAIDDLTTMSKNMRDDIKTLLEQFDKFKKDQQLDLLKFGFWTMANSENPPIEECLIAGLKYISLGGNHDTKKKTIKLAKENPAVYKIIVKIQPNLRLAEVDCE